MQANQHYLRPRQREGWVAKENEENFCGDGNDLNLYCEDGFIGVYISQNS